MRTNTLLTYLLYALLAGLICVAAYKTYQMKHEQAQSAKENAEFEKRLRDLGYIEEDTTGSRYTGDQDTFATPSSSSTSVVKTPAASDGIEGDYPASTTTTTTTKPAKPATKPADPAPASTRETKPVSEPSLSDSNESSASDGRYRVVVGSFTKLDGARREMERLIKKGYQSAEIGKLNRGKFATVVILRTNSLSEANRVLDKLEGQGFDAQVIDRQRK